MNKTHRHALVFPASFGVLAALACLCSTSPAKPQTPQATVAPLVVGDDLTQVDVCQAIPREDIEAVMGRKLVSAPEAFDYYGTGDTAGCSYDGGKDSDNTAYFGYVVLTPVSVYGEQPLYQDKDVTGLGQEAYFNNGADARQLWVKVNDNLAFVVAFGDQPNEEGALALARLVLAALQ